MSETEPTSTPIKVRGLSDGLSSLWYPLVAIAVALWFIYLEVPSPRERASTAILQAILVQPGEHNATLSAHEAIERADKLLWRIKCQEKWVLQDKDWKYDKSTP